MEERAHRLELTIALEPRGEPISGSVSDAHRRRRTFCGWLELMDVLDGVRRRSEPEPTDLPDRPGVTK